MTKIAIVTDSSANLSQETIKQLPNVYSVPIVVTLNGVDYREGIDISNPEFYQLMNDSKQLPTTTPPTPTALLNLYDELKEAGYDEVISIHITSGVTGLINNLKMALLDYDNIKVHVFDSFISLDSMGYMVKYAAKLVDDGLDSAAILEQLTDLRDTLGTYFVVDELKNLVASGRLSNAAGFAGSVLKIKPVLTLNEEHRIFAIDKIRTLKKAISAIEAKFDYDYHNKDYPLHVMLMGSNNDDKLMAWKEKLTAQYPKATFTVSQIGPIIGTHVGNNAFALLWCKQIPEVN